MELKPRAFDPRYVFRAKNDFQILSGKHRLYDEHFNNHPIWPDLKYHEEVKRIKQEWSTKVSHIAGQSLDKDLENLLMAYQKIKGDYTLITVVINSLFGVLYDHFSDMLRDNEIGYLSDADYNAYLQQYKEAIETNKRCGLDCWNKPTVTQIEQQIAQSLKSKH
ncbi:MAG: hypothetical protein QM737_01455 [Ferruginibacter sp.]